MPEDNEYMSEAGQVLKNNKVSKVFFVHGTFVGGDPLGINWLFSEDNGGVIPSWISSQFNETVKEVVDKTLKDNGNFTKDYVDEFCQAINLAIKDDNQIKCVTQGWSGQNNHVGRLEAVLDLVQNIADSNGERILLIGHSHAAQVFAIMTLFLENKEKSKVLFECLEEIVLDKDKLEQFKQNLNKVLHFDLDIVTLGAPVRYPWGIYDKYRLLNIVNHRSEVSLDGVLSTRDGDYVQHWGINGTDIKVVNKPEHLQSSLDEVLDKGNLDLETLNNIRSESERRKHKDSNGGEIGINLFIDYNDQGSTIFHIPFLSKAYGTPNFIKSCLGHGVYTKKENMWRNMKLIVESFYQ